jgi:hypothetical protein
VTQTARDVFTSINVWSFPFRNRKPSLADITSAAWANYRLASDRQLLEGCGITRGAAKPLLQTGLRKMDRGDPMTEPELRVVLYLGNRFIWKPAFTDDQLFEDFRSVLLKNRILAPDDADALGNAKSFLALYAIACKHGSSIQIDTTTSGQLFAGFSNKRHRLELKVQIKFEDGPKPIMAPICMFLTSLQPEAVCHAALLDLGSEWQANAWSRPIEINAEGKLALIS